MTAGITADQTEITVVSASGYPSQFPFTIVIDPDTLSEEMLEVSNVAGTVFTVSRGFDSTTPASHGLGAVVKHVISAADLREPQEHIAATESVHGIADTAFLVTLNGSQTLTNKTIDYNNNTITNLPIAGDASVSTVFMLGGM